MGELSNRIVGSATLRVGSSVNELCSVAIAGCCVAAEEVGFFFQPFLDRSLCRCQIQQQYVSFCSFSFRSVLHPDAAVVSYNFVLGWCIYLLDVRWMPLRPRVVSADLFLVDSSKFLKIAAETCWCRNLL
ncbi:hypothetical protein U1Q18_041920 [Sarracenia purpurea var. burkii]